MQCRGNDEVPSDVRIYSVPIEGYKMLQRRLCVEEAERELVCSRFAPVGVESGRRMTSRRGSAAVG